uniref:Uncharacterized protein n=1 Tax=Octopus bimaculoides TaxID=37653 RepID=A0A0L8GJG7_OCTBM
MRNANWLLPSIPGFTSSGWIGMIAPSSPR